MKYRKFRERLADMIGRWGVRLLKLANWIEPPARDDWGNCHVPIMPGAKVQARPRVVDKRWN